MENIFSNFPGVNHQRGVNLINKVFMTYVILSNRVGFHALYDTHVFVQNGSEIQEVECLCVRGENKGMFFSSGENNVPYKRNIF